ncbi:piggyBac transposable element-derived protein 4-like [Onthophagus taurus]|uniref:piggyBac transposable element-derived protein 4-like n=1 Tax=Onthophagus taurus TaxID=166361 RepID=UPI0039BE35F8
MSTRKNVKYTDADFEATALKWYEEIESDGEGSEYEDNVEPISEYENEISESDISDSEIIDSSGSSKKNVILGKNGYKWSTLEPPRTKTQHRNIVVKIPGLQGPAKNVTNEFEAWKILFTADMIESIVVYTNQEIERQKLCYNMDTRYVQFTDVSEILALIGILYIAGVRKDAHFVVREMFSNEGPKIYKCIMSEPRFTFLLSCLRFDDKNIRNRQDKFAPIRQLWEPFIKNCTECYTPHAYCTIDEQLLGFRGNCPFRVYIASKPDKYGLKINTMCDSRTYYMVSALPYIGKEDRISKEPVSTQIVKKLAEPIYGTNRNITMDNYFTSIPLAHDMLKNHKLTIVGTLRNNKREIPPSFLPNRKKEILSSQFAFAEKTTLVSFTPKRSKSVILLSTVHSTATIDEQSKKPEIILFYNSTKGAVDTFDQMAHNYTVARKTKRWPLRFLFGMVDQAGINAYIIFNLSTKPDKPNRKQFLNKLGVQLARNYMEYRLKGKLPNELRKDIEKVLDINTPEEDELPAKRLKSGRCHLCPRIKDRKSKICCVKCNKPVCTDHRLDICFSCKK